MGDEQKPQASFLLRKNGAAAAASAPPAQPSAPQANPVAQAQSALFQKKGSMSAIPGLNAPPGSVRSPSLISGKLKMPGSKTKSVLLRAASIPKMSAIRPAMNLAPAPAAPAIPEMMRPGGGSLANVQALHPQPSTQPAPEAKQAEEPAENAPAQQPFDARAAAEQFLQQGLDHYDRGELEQALGTYKEAIKADPSFAMAYNNLGMVLIDLERYQEALDVLWESVRRDANYGEAYNNLGFVLRRQGNNLQAASAYRRFLDLEPDVEEGERIAGWVDSVLGENGLSTAPRLEIPPRPGGELPPSQDAKPPKIKKMAAWEVAAGNTDMAVPVNAIGEFEPSDSKPAPSRASVVAPASALGPASVSAVNPKTNIILRTQQVPALGSTVSRKPGAPITPEDRNRSVNLVEQSLDEFASGNLEQAYNLALQALEADPENGEAHTSLGKILVRQEKLKEGIEHLEKAIQFTPIDPAPYYVLGFTLRAMDRNVEAAEIYETFLRLMPDALDSAKMRQWIMHVKGVNEAEGSPAFEDDGFEDVEAIVTETDKAYHAALENFKTCSGGQTVEDCERILQEAPDHVRTYLLLGRAHLRLSDFDRSADAFSRALDLQPSSAEAKYFLGLCYEKSGDSPKALKAYRKYVEDHPDGPRVEKLRAWFLAHGLADTGKGLSQHIQCEWCLRFFDESEISLHESKATCNGCLTLMGSTPIQDAAKLETVDGAESAADSFDGVRRKGSIFRKLLLLGTAAAAALVAVGYFTALLDPYLAMAGISKKNGAPVPAQQQTSATTVIADTAQGPAPQQVVVKGPVLSPRFDGTKVRIINTPEKEFSVFSKWTWKPEIEGLSELDNLQGWKKEYFLKDRPLGMAVEDGSVVWTSDSKDFEALKRGEKYTVELTIKGYWIGPEGARKDLFSTSKTFTVGTQFGYDVGPELELGLAPDSRNIQLMSMDANGDGQKDLIVTHGSMGQGSAQALLFSADGSKQAMTLAEGARYSAACALPLNGNPNSGVLTANWQSGEVKLFLMKNGRLDGTPPVKFAPGIVSVAAVELERNKSAVAAFSGAAGTLLVSTYNAETGFGPVVAVPMPGGGGKGHVLIWKSAELGLGFLVVTPLAEDPLRFVPCNKGEWDKSGSTTVRSSMKDEGVITASVPVACAKNGSQRLALVVGGKTSRLLLMEEKDGKFTQVGSKTALPGPGLGAIASDFNKDGCEDLFVVMRDDVCFYFLDESGTMLPGPHFANPGMLGPVALLGHGDARPEIAVLNENKKARLFKSVGVERSAGSLQTTAPVTNADVVK